MNTSVPANSCPSGRCAVPPLFAGNGGSTPRTLATNLPVTSARLGSAPNSEVNLPSGPPAPASAIVSAAESMPHMPSENIPGEALVASPLPPSSPLGTTSSVYTAPLTATPVPPLTNSPRHTRLAASVPPPNQGSLPLIPLTSTPPASPPGSPRITLPRSATSVGALSVPPHLSTLTVDNYQGLVANHSVEEELLKNGYTPVAKLAIPGKGVPYIKAVNSLGQLVLVLVDVPGYANLGAEDVQLNTSERASLIPLSLKIGAMECAGLSVCGVAFECGDEFCTLARSPGELQPREVVFSQNPITSATITSPNRITTYPIIRLSEIKANPNLVLANTSRLVSEYHNKLYAILRKELSETKAAADRAAGQVHHLERVVDSLTPDLKHSLGQFTTLHERWMVTPPHTDEQRKKFQVVQYNLALRNNWVRDILDSLREVSQQRGVLERVSENAQAAAESLLGIKNKITQVLQR